MTHFPTLSIVAPIYNESGNLAPLIQEIETALQSYSATWEIILVDDGSTDESRKIQTLLKLHRVSNRYF
ncbi:MAG: glycosyltransferase [Verrucomicrobiia bacterium]